MLFTENNKSIDLTISGYQFPEEKSSKKEYNYDANWLICEIKYSEGSFTQTYTDACLLTDELEELTIALKRIINGCESSYISAFMEPYLQISIASAAEKIMFVIHFVYDTNGIWKKIKVSSFVEKEYAMRILDELIEMQAKYPER